MKKKHYAMLAIFCMVCAIAIAVYAEEKAKDAVPIKKLAINNHPARTAVTTPPQGRKIYDQIMREQQKMRQQMDKMFSDPYFKAPLDMNIDRMGGMGYPSSRYIERPNKYVLQVVTPGMDKKDISIQLSGNTLTIKGSDKNQTDKKDKGSESYQQFSKQFTQSFTIPQDADSSKIKSNYKNGILTVAIPKDEAKAKQNIKNIPIG